MAKAELGAMVSSVRGTVGGVVVTSGRGGTVVRRKPLYRRPTSPLQAQAEARMRGASAAWSSLSAEGAAAWRAYGERHGRTAQTAFVALATKFLMVQPSGEAPLLPPIQDFLPDDVAVSAGSPPTLPSPTGVGEASGILFAASGPNRVGTVTELLVQALPNERRSPTRRYGSAGFVAFVAPSLSHLLPLDAGIYAVGYRFVRAATGEMGPTILLGVVRVG